jgi:enterobactin synthetase component D
LIEVADIPHLSSFFTLDKGNYPLFEEEKRQIDSFASTRKIDFSTGRYCARKVLETFGKSDVPLLIGSNREPLWPEGYIGSISHSKNLCGAIAGKLDQFRSLGLDIEELSRIQPNIINHVCTPDESLFLQQFDAQTQLHYTTLTFAMKEAFYKFQFPITRQYVGFQQVEIDPSSPQIEFKIKHPEIARNLAEIKMKASYCTTNEHIVCIVHASQ